VAAEARAKEEAEAAIRVAQQPPVEEKVAVPVVEEVAVARKPEKKKAEVKAEGPVVLEPALVAAEKSEEKAAPEPEAPEQEEEPHFEPPMAPPEKGQIRFAEDFMLFRPPKPGARVKKVKKKGTHGRAGFEEDAKARGAAGGRRGTGGPVEDED